MKFVCCFAYMLLAEPPTGQTVKTLASTGLAAAISTSLNTLKPERTLGKTLNAKGLSMAEVLEGCQASIARKEVLVEYSSSGASWRF